MSRILIADDEDSIRFVLREVLEQAGHDVTEASDGKEARTRLVAESFEIAFLDIRMPGISGLDLLDEIRTRGLDGPVTIIMTAQNSFENAVLAMQRGAFDYLTKPFDLSQIRALTEKVVRQQSLRNEVASLRRQLGGTFRPGESLIGHSPRMLETFKTVGRVAASDTTVLLRGESGTGKELIARAIHYHSDRRDRPFVAVNMSALPADLIEAELFGHERGAFTGAVEARAGRFREAEGGTLLLDEIGDLPLPLQSKLLRVLQEHEITPIGSARPVPIDVRILAATHQDLEKAIREKLFREDLYFRLNVVPIQIAPLRKRREDIPPLVKHFVERFSRELGVPCRWPSVAALEQLVNRPWRGNVRELENTIKRALVLASGDVLTEEDLRGGTDTNGTAADHWTLQVQQEFTQQLDSGEAAPEPGPYWSFVQQLERAVITIALQRSSGNQIQAARLLGINRNTLRHKIRELGVTID